MFFFNISGDSNAQIDHMLRSINCSVQKSIDVNGSDLPLSGNCANYFYIHNLVMNFINNLFLHSCRSIHIEIFLQFRIRGKDQLLQTNS